MLNLKVSINKISILVIFTDCKLKLIFINVVKIRISFIRLFTNNMNICK